LPRWGAALDHLRMNMLRTYNGAGTPPFLELQTLKGLAPVEISQEIVKLIADATCWI
jgi:hypothetical protein